MDPGFLLPKMKVLLIIHRHQARGQELVASQLGEEFLSRGMEVRVVSLYPGDFSLPFFGTISCLNLHSSISVWNLQKWFEFSRWVADFDPDIIQANGGDTLKFLALTSFLLPKKAKRIFNNGGVMGYYLKSTFQKRLNAFFLSRMNGLVSVSDYSRSDLDKLFNPTAPHQVIPVSVIPPDQQETDNVEFTWIHIGGFTPEKNHKGLIAIFSEAVKQGIEGNLILVGKGPLKPEIERQVDRLNLEKRVRFAGALIDPWSMISNRSVLLLPSVIEGMPAVLGEALCLGVPSICYTVGGVEQLLKEFPSLIGIAPGQSRSFVTTMLHLQKNWDFHLGKSMQDKKRAQQFFSISRAADDFLNFYKKL